MNKYGFKVNFCKWDFWVKGVYSLKIFTVTTKLNAFNPLSICTPTNVSGKSDFLLTSKGGALLPICSFNHGHFLYTTI